MNYRTRSLRSFVTTASAAALLASTFVVTAPPAEVSAVGSCPITVLESGSTTVYPALEAAKAGFQTAQDCTLNLVASGSGTGLTALRAGTINVAASSRPLNSTEQAELFSWKIGGDAMVIVVNKNLNLDNIKASEVKAIYEGTLTDWSQIAGSSASGPIVPRARITASGSQPDFLRLFSVTSSLEAATITATGLPRLTTSEDEANAVCNNANQIAYTSLANLLAYGPAAGANQCLKALNVAAGSTTNYVAPSVQSVQNNTYPAPRALYLAVRKFSLIGGAQTTDNSANVKAYDLVNYMLTSAGQTAVAQVGFVTEAIPASQRIPDFDINLDGAIGLADIGNITGRWGQTSTCKGWIRADATNDGAVGLADIGRVTSRWGGTGFVAP